MPRSPTGTRLAITVAALGLILALIGLKFRVFTPPTSRPVVTQPFEPQ
jgi:hypothetical protein